MQILVLSDPRRVYDMMGNYTQLVFVDVPVQEVSYYWTFEQTVMYMNDMYKPVLGENSSKRGYVCRPDTCTCQGVNPARHDFVHCVFIQ